MSSLAMPAEESRQLKLRRKDRKNLQVETQGAEHRESPVPRVPSTERARSPSSAERSRRAANDGADDDYSSFSLDVVVGSMEVKGPLLSPLMRSRLPWASDRCPSTDTPRLNRCQSPDREYTARPLDGDHPIVNHVPKEGASSSESASRYATEGDSPEGQSFCDELENFVVET
jgi:hypothetical protein